MELPRVLRTHAETHASAVKPLTPACRHDNNSIFLYGVSVLFFRQPETIFSPALLTIQSIFHWHFFGEINRLAIVVVRFAIFQNF